MFEEQVIEHKKGAAQRLADFIDTRASIGIECQAVSEPCPESSPSDSSVSTSGSCQRTASGRKNSGVETKDQSAVDDVTA